MQNNKFIIHLGLIGIFVLISCNSKPADNEAESQTSPNEEVLMNPIEDKPINYVLGDTQITSSGLKVLFTELKGNKKPQNGDVVKVHYRGALTNGNEFDNSFKRGEPIAFTLGIGQVIPGWDEGISLLGTGDKATFVIPPKLAYGDRSMGNGLIPANSTLIFDVELVDFKEAYKPFDIRGKDSFTTATGLKYYVIEKGDLSSKPKPGNKAIAHYAGYLTNGTKFDASYDRGEPFVFPVGEGRVIKGWDEIILLMGRGSKYRVIIPPALGYGLEGAGSIPANATLIFDMELIDFK